MTSYFRLLYVYTYISDLFRLYACVHTLIRTENHADKMYNELIHIVQPILKSSYFESIYRKWIRCSQRDCSLQHCWVYRNTIKLENKEPVMRSTAWQKDRTMRWTLIFTAFVYWSQFFERTCLHVQKQEKHKTDQKNKKGRLLFVVFFCNSPVK